jgi:AbrB family looped-hinge helix DNA binding protein
MDATLTLGQQGRLVIPAEVRSRLGLHPGDRLRLRLSGTQLILERPEDAVAALRSLAGVLRETPGGRALSLGDRCCLALALRETRSEVLTADRAWEALDLPLQVRLLR